MVSFLVLSRRVTGQRDRIAISPTVRTITLHTHAVSEISAAGMCLEIFLPIPNLRIGFENGPAF